MGKNIKSYATTQVHFPREREGSPMAKCPNVQIFQLKYGTVLPYTFVSKFTSKIFHNFLLTFCTLANFQRIKQNSLNSPTYSTNDTKFASIIDPFTLCFRYLPRQRTLMNSSKLRKFCTVHPHSP